MLVALMDESKQVSAEQMDRWAASFDNWGDCDTACFALFDRTARAWQKVDGRATDVEHHQAAVTTDAVVVVHHRGALGELAEIADDRFGIALRLAPSAFLARALAVQLALGDRRQRRVAQWQGQQLGHRQAGTTSGARENNSGGWSTGCSRSGSLRSFGLRICLGGPCLRQRASTESDVGTASTSYAA